MNHRFIENLHIPLKYEKKEGTKGSFLQVDGEKGILPERISWGMFAKCRASSRDSYKVSEINAQYKKLEPGAYKGLNGGKIHTSIWKSIPEFPEFSGYGIIDERHDLFDLLIIYSENLCTSSMEIHIFKGMGKPDFLENAFSFLRNYQKKKPHQYRASMDIYESGLH